MTDELKTPSGNAPAILPALINSLLESCQVIIGQPEGTTSTFAHVYLPGGFYLATGFSACVSQENFDAEKGAQIAQQDAVHRAKDELWKLEGYRLYCTLQEQQGVTIN